MTAAKQFNQMFYFLKTVFNTLSCRYAIRVTSHGRHGVSYPRHFDCLLSHILDILTVYFLIFSTFWLFTFLSSGRQESKYQSVASPGLCERNPSRQFWIPLTKGQWCGTHLHNMFTHFRRCSRSRRSHKGRVCWVRPGRDPGTVRSGGGTHRSCHP